MRIARRRTLAAPLPARLLLALYAATTLLVAWQQMRLGHVNNFLTFRDKAFSVRVTTNPAG